MQKLYDIVAKVGEYQGKDGETKAKWQTVGALLEGDKGPFLMLAKWFNPAGVPDARGGENILLSLFKPKEQDGDRSQRDSRPQQNAAPAAAREVFSASKTRAKQAAPAPAPVAGDDEIPF